MTTFSLVVPTLRRADTLEHTLATLLVQESAEIVVQNNGNDPATRALVQGLDDLRVRHFSTEDVVSMTENWELALSHATGDVVMFVGDDDGLMPDACAIAASVFESHDAEILSWAPFLYLWPGFWDTRRENRLEATVNFDFTVDWVSTAPLLRRFYAFEAHYSKLPMIYNSFVRRSVLGRVAGRHGKYFLGSTPDVTSGIVNAASCTAFLHSSRPLSVAGLSRHSSGHRLTRSDDRATRSQVERDFPRLAAAPESGRLSNLEYLIGSEMQIVAHEVLADREVEFSKLGLVRSIAAAINESPSQYDETRALIDALVERYGLDRADVEVPERSDHPPAAPDGVRAVGPYEVLFVIDGRAVGLSSIADAVALAAQLAPSSDAMTKSASPVPSDAVPLVSSEPLSFARGAAGGDALITGWAEREPWGTWSVDREATLSIALPESANGSVRLALDIRTLPLPANEPRVVECTIGGRVLERWEFSEADYRGVRAIEVPVAAAVDGIVNFTFVNHNAYSPKELGLSEDGRQLGIGVERIRVVEETPPPRELPMRH